MNNDIKLEKFDKIISDLDNICEDCRLSKTIFPI